jgi:hypothetical protein
MSGDPDALLLRVSSPNLTRAIEMLKALRGLELYPEAYQVLVLERSSRELQTPPKEIRLAREVFEALPRAVQQMLMAPPTRYGHARPYPHLLEGHRANP